MALVDKTSPPQPAPGAIALPSQYPELPDDILSRFPSMQRYQRRIDDHYRKFRSSIYDFQDQLGGNVSKALTSGGKGSDVLIRATRDELSAEILIERDARVEGDSALATTLTALTATVGANTAAITVESTARATADTAISSTVTALTATVGANTAAITAESTARATADTAISSTVTTLTATVGSNTAAITAESTARSTADTSLATTLTALTTTVGNNTAAITAESTARSTADTSLATRATNLEASVNTAGTGLLARVATVESAYVTAAGAEAISNNRISASLSSAVAGTIGAAITTEQNARVTANGFLSGKYSLKVIAGDIVTGMNISSSTGAGTDTSEVTFQASSFKIYNGTSNVPAFNLTGGALSINAAVTIGNAQVNGLGTLATLNSVSWTSGVANRPSELTDGRITTAISAAGLVVTGVRPGIAVSAGGVAGLYLGSDYLGFYNGTAWRTYMDNAGNFFLSGAGAHGMSWNGSTLSISGNITLQNTIPSGSVNGLGALATQSSVAYGDVIGAKPPSNADVTLTALTGVGGLGLTGGGLTLLSGGAAIKGGMTAYDTGTGFWLGDVAGTTKLSIGNSAADKLLWTGGALEVTGKVTATSGSVGGFIIGSGQLYGAGGPSPILLTTGGTVAALVGSFTTSLASGTGNFTGTVTAPTFNATP